MREWTGGVAGGANVGEAGGCPLLTCSWQHHELTRATKGGGQPLLTSAGQEKRGGWGGEKKAAAASGDVRAGHPAAPRTAAVRAEPRPSTAAPRAGARCRGVPTRPRLAATGPPTARRRRRRVGCAAAGGGADTVVVAAPPAVAHSPIGGPKMAGQGREGGAADAPHAVSSSDTHARPPVRLRLPVSHPHCRPRRQVPHG